MSADSLKHPGDRMMIVNGPSDLTPTEKNVMVALAYHDGPGGCRPTLDRLAALLGMNRFTVSDHLNNIRKKGYLWWRRGRYGNVYHIKYDNPAVREILTAGHNSDVGKSPTSGNNSDVGDSPILDVGESPTQTGIEPESIPPLYPPRKQGGAVSRKRRRGKQGTLDITAQAVHELLTNYENEE